MSPADITTAATSVGASHVASPNSGSCRPSRPSLRLATLPAPPAEPAGEHLKAA